MLLAKAFMYRYVNMHAGLGVCYIKFLYDLAWQKSALTGANANSEAECARKWGVSCISSLVHSPSCTLCLCVCVYVQTHFSLSKKDMDVDTKDNTAMGEGWGFIKLFPSALLYSPVYIMRQDGRGTTASVWVKLGAKDLADEMQWG